MNIETLKIFCDLSELRSFSKTADKHMLSQSAISQQLAQLELAHNCQLVNRKKRPIELTKAGKLLYQTSRDVIERIEQFKSELASLKDSATNRVNLAAIFSIGMHALPDYLKKFMVKYPKVNVHIEYLDAEKIYEQVLSGAIDIGIVAVPKKDKRLDVFDFKKEALVLVCSPKHPLAKFHEINIHRLQFEKMICFEEGLATRTWIDNTLKRYNIEVSPVMEFDNIETIKRAVEINSGVSILPATTIVQEVAAGSIKAISFVDENFYRPTGIILRKGKVVSQSSRHFIELLAENLIIPRA